MSIKSSMAVLALGWAVLPATPVQAATYSESYTFNAELVTKEFTCQPDIATGDYELCNDADPQYADATRSLLPFDMAVGAVFTGAINIDIDDVNDRIVGITCDLGGKNCLFNTDLLNSAPFGPRPVLDFSENSVVSSVFNFQTGTYGYVTDYLSLPSGNSVGHFYYSNVRFNLSDVAYNGKPSIIPLPGGLPLLLGAMGVLGLGRKLRKKA
ncbi:hypothetical protein [Paracoccus sp. (in: a-proteobacteria)]|uniref:hypothetical protein n=1 Tax=Paracoccus sp. TaxID=267 RepID=UPI003A898A51